MTPDELREKVIRLYADKWGVTDAWLADAAIAVVLEEAASLKFLRPLVEKQSLGEWHDKTIDEDVAMFAAAIRALGKLTAAAS